MAELRVLIDFATGNNWQMPVHLYERYCAEVSTITVAEGKTPVQSWLDTLTGVERILVERK